MPEVPVKQAKVARSSQPNKGIRYGGRAKGTPNKARLPLKEKAEQLGVDPFEILLLFAKGDWKALGYETRSRIVAVTKDGDPIEEEVIRPTDRLKAASEATQYLEPKRKAIEHSGPDGAPIGYQNLTEIPDDQLDAKIQAMLDKGRPGE